MKGIGLLDALKKMMQEQQNVKANKNIGKTGPLDSRPTADIAYQLERSLSRIDNSDSEERAMKALADQEKAQYPHSVDFPPSYQNKNQTGRSDRFEMFRELRKRGVK